jgi:hypothetical protein
VPEFKWGGDIPEMENPYSGILFRFIPVYSGYSGILFWMFRDILCMGPSSQILKLEDKCAKMA